MHELHPPGPNWFSINASGLGLRYLLVLAFLDRRAMKVLFAVGETQVDGLNMTAKTNMTSAGNSIHRFQFATFLTFIRTHTLVESFGFCNYLVISDPWRTL